MICCYGRNSGLPWMSRWGEMLSRVGAVNIRIKLCVVGECKSQVDDELAETYPESLPIMLQTIAQYPLGLFLYGPFVVFQGGCGFLLRRR